MASHTVRSRRYRVRTKGLGQECTLLTACFEEGGTSLDRRTIFLAAENPRGTPAFRDLTTQPPLGEDHFRGLWKLYFLSILANYIRHHLDTNKIENEASQEVIKFLVTNELLAPNVTLLGRLKAAGEYLRRWLPALEAGVTDPNTGLVLTGKITLGEPTPEQRGLGYRSLDDLLGRLNEGFAKLKITAWLVLDRLDVAFAESDELEGNALRSLFRTYLDMRDLTQFQLKVFLRDDIWKKIVSAGFREASHITRTTSLSWDRQSLLNLIVSRLVSNVLICDHYGVNAEDVLASAEKQEWLFYQTFPSQIDRGRSKSKTLDWMIARVADGTKRTAPREVIHLLLEARDEQLSHFELGNVDPPNQQLLDSAALRAALPRVSQVRYEQTLCAEHPALKPYLDRLEREKAEQNTETLSAIWGMPIDEAAKLCERMVDVGFFERRGTKVDPIYWVPFLYRDALDLVQGSAIKKAKKARGTQ